MPPINKKQADPSGRIKFRLSSFECYFNVGTVAERFVARLPAAAERHPGLIDQSLLTAGVH